MELVISEKENKISIFSLINTLESFHFHVLMHIKNPSCDWVLLFLHQYSVNQKWPSPWTHAIEALVLGAWPLCLASFTACPVLKPGWKSMVKPCCCWKAWPCPPQLHPPALPVLYRSTVQPWLDSGASPGELFSTAKTTHVGELPPAWIPGLRMPPPPCLNDSFTACRLHRNRRKSKSPKWTGVTCCAPAEALCTPSKKLGFFSLLSLTCGIVSWNAHCKAHNCFFSRNLS